MSWFAELKRRRVFRTVIVYLVAAWLAIQVAGATFEQVGLPAWTVRLVIALAVLGLPLAIGLAWAFDLGPRGLEPARQALPDPPPPDAVATPVPPTLPPTLVAAQAVAVLPFVDMSAARDQEHFGDGIAEEIINALCCVRSLRVAARTSSFQFKGRASDVREIGRVLRVGSVVEGSVRRADDRIRVTAQLIDANEGFHLWSESFDRRLEDVFALQSEIARCIVQALKVSLTPAEVERMDRGGTASPRAYELFLRARQLVREHSDTSIMQAADVARLAVQADPQFALAHATLADALSAAMSWNVASARHCRDEALAAAERAAVLHPGLPDAQLARANLLSAAGRTADADAAFDEALAGNPGSFDAHLFYGRHAFASGQHAKAIRMYQRAHELQPDDYQTLALLATSYRKVGDLAHFTANSRAAMTRIDRHLELYPEDVRALQLGSTVLAGLGERERAAEFAERALALRPDQFAAIYNAACAFALIGERERALGLVERFRESGWGNLDWIAEDPDLDSIRDEPRFKAVMQALANSA
jgi:adenylate cyclase